LSAVPRHVCAVYIDRVRAGRPVFHEGVKEGQRRCRRRPNPQVRGTIGCRPVGGMSAIHFQAARKESSYKGTQPRTDRRRRQLEAMSYVCIDRSPRISITHSLRFRLQLLQPLLLSRRPTGQQRVCLCVSACAKSLRRKIYNTLCQLLSPVQACFVNTRPRSATLRGLQAHNLYLASFVSACNQKGSTHLSFINFLATITDRLQFTGCLSQLERGRPSPGF